MGSFADGFGMGQRMVGDALDRQRQEKMDTIYTKQADLQARAAQNSLAIQEQGIADEKDRRAALAPASVNSNAATLDSGDGPRVYDFGNDSANIAGSDAVQDKRLAALPTSTQEPDSAADAAAPAAPPVAGPITAAAGAALPSLATPQIKQTTSVNGTAYADPASGLKAAADYNDPYQQDLRYANTLKAQGKGIEASQYLQQQHGLRVNAVLNHFGEQLQKLGPKVAVEEIYKQYPDGNTAQVVMDANGVGGVVNKIDGNGKIVGQIKFKDNADLYGQVKALVDPASTYANRLAVESKIAEERAKPINTPFGGETMVWDEKSGKYKVINSTASNRDMQATDVNGEPMFDASGAPIMKKTSGGGSSATSKEWHDAGVSAEKYFAVGEPDINGKYQSSPALQTLFTTFQGDLRAQGKDPWDANSALASTLHQVRAAAEQDVAAAKQQDKKSTLTLEQALSNRVSAIFKNRDAALAGQKKVTLRVPGAPAAAPAPAATKPSTTPAAPPAAAPATKPAAKPSAPVVAPPVAQDPAQVKASRIAELQAKLATDNKIKGTGLMGWGGLGARAIDAGAMPLGMSQRIDIENELKQLGGQ